MSQLHLVRDGHGHRHEAVREDQGYRNPGSWSRGPLGGRMVHAAVVTSSWATGTTPSAACALVRARLRGPVQCGCSPLRRPRRAARP